MKTSVYKVVDIKENFETNNNNFNNFISTLKILFNEEKQKFGFILTGKTGKQQKVLNCNSLQDALNIAARLINIKRKKVQRKISRFFK